MVKVISQRWLVLSIDVMDALSLLSDYQMEIRI